MGASIAASIGDWATGHFAADRTRAFSPAQLALLQELTKGLAIGIAEQLAKYLASFEVRIATLESTPTSQVKSSLPDRFDINEHQSEATAQSLPVEASPGNSKTRRRNARRKIVRNKISYSRETLLQLCAYDELSQYQPKDFTQQRGLHTLHCPREQVFIEESSVADERSICNILQRITTIEGVVNGFWSFGNHARGDWDNDYFCGHGGVPAALLATQSASVRRIQRAWRKHRQHHVSFETWGDATGTDHGLGSYEKLDAESLKDVIEELLLSRPTLKLYQFASNSIIYEHEDKFSVESEGNASDNHSDGFFNDFEIIVSFVRPDGRLEFKDPNWVSDCGFDVLAAGVFGSTEAWSKMEANERRQCSEKAIMDFYRCNTQTWDDWFADFERRRKNRVNRRF